MVPKLMEYGKSHGDTEGTEKKKRRIRKRMRK
jgi:hypothetical protein